MQPKYLQILGIQSEESSDPQVLVAATHSVEKHARRAMRLLSIKHPLAITVYPQASWCIPDTGETGYTPSADWMQITLDLTGRIHPVATVIEKRIPPVVYHEMNHVKRWLTTGFGTTFREHVVTEGLATAFEMDQVKHDIHPFFVVSQEEIGTILKLVKENKDRILTAYNYDEWFVRGSAVVPKWAGYKLGYYLIQEALRCNASQNVIALTSVPAEEIIQMSGVLLPTTGE